MKIYAPVKDATGTWASVRFVNGVGETDNPRLIEWFKTHGYKVEEVVEKQEFNYIIDSQNDIIDGQNEQIEPDFDAMTPNELRQWAIERGLGSKIRNTRNKEKLLEILRG